MVKTQNFFDDLKCTLYVVAGLGARTGSFPNGGRLRSHAPNAASDGQFLQAKGFSIAISGDTVIAGTQSQFSIPAVYIFQ